MASFTRIPENNNQPLPPGDSPNRIVAVTLYPVLVCSTLYLMEVETGRESCHFCFEHDLVHRQDHMGIQLRRYLLCIYVLRSQTLQIFRLRESMVIIVQECRLGSSHNDDYETEINRINS